MIESVHRSLRPDELPSPSAALVLWKAHAEALMGVLGPKKAERYLRTMAERMALEETFAEVVTPIRRGAQHDETQAARRQAVAYFSRTLPVLLARLPRA